MENYVRLFHRLTRTAYLYNGCLPLYSIVLTSRVHSSVKYSQQSTFTAADSCDGGISVLNHCLSWSKFVNTHLYHSSQWFNIHLYSAACSSTLGSWDRQASISLPAQLVCDKPCCQPTHSWSHCSNVV